MTDIVPELYEKIRSDFEKAVAADAQIQRFMNRIRDGTATMHETSLFARYLGDHLAEVLKANIAQDILPDGRMYYNIADRIIRPMLTNNHDLTIQAATEVQQVLDEVAGIHIRPIISSLQKDRIDRLIWAISGEGIDWNEVLNRMDEPVRNISQSFLDDFVRENADFRHKAGIQSTIIRTLAGDSCEWCRNLAGSYTYPDVPKDIYRRHDKCRCTVTFKSGKRQQDVWTKAWSTPELTKERKTLGTSLTRLTSQQAQQKEAEVISRQKKR